jgi:hypothetical protein
MTFTNQSVVTLSGFAIQFDKNVYCFAPAPLPLGSLSPQQSQNVTLPVAVVPQMEVCVYMCVLFCFVCLVLCVYFCFPFKMISLLPEHLPQIF